MKTQIKLLHKKEIYVSPSIEIVEIVLEAGIAFTLISAGDEFEEDIYEL